MVQTVFIEKSKQLPQRQAAQIQEQRAARREMPVDPGFQIFDAATGPTVGQIGAAQQAANFPKTLGFLLHNTNTTGNPAKITLFDAMGGYAEANTYTQPSGVTITATNFLYALLREQLKQGRKLLINKIDLQILAPSNDVSQFANEINVVTHGVSIKQSSYLTSILPTNFVNENAYQDAIKNMNVDLVIDGLFAFEMKLNIATKVSMILHVAGTN